MAKKDQFTRTNSSEDRLERQSHSSTPLTRINFILMAAAAVVIIIGFLLMCGPGSTETEFNPDIFSTRRIVVGPTISFLGYIFMGVAIMWGRRNKKSSNAAE